MQSEFIRHHHETKDELFLVVNGTLTIKLRQGDIHIHAGEFAIIPRGIEHCPVADSKVEMLLLEPKSTLNTGTVQNERTVEAEWISS